MSATTDALLRRLRRLVISETALPNMAGDRATRIRHAIHDIADALADEITLLEARR